MPARNIRLRPNRSATRPKNSVNPAAHRANAVMIHCRFPVVNPRSAPMCGRATLRTEKSTARVKLAVSSTMTARRWRVVMRGGAEGRVSRSLMDMREDLSFRVRGSPGMEGCSRRVELA